MRNSEKILVSEPLAKTRDFWDANPCDGQSNLSLRMRFRYEKEPWLLPLLDRISSFGNILEVGCGQGTDALYCCSRMKTGASYTALDLSPKSVEAARRAAEEAGGMLRVMPLFSEGNAEALDLPDERFDSVVSLGVLHHTENLDRALGEVHRVLVKGGEAYISLYRRFSPKLLGAHALRLILRPMGGINQMLLSGLKGIGTDHPFGTMIHECVGVPILRSYTRRDLVRQFAGFREMEIQPVGVGLKLFSANSFIDRNLQWLGAQWLVRAVK
jgi:SAM-dependent methyltransferase